MEKSWNSLEDKLQDGNVHKVGQMLYRLTTLALVAGLSVVFVVWCVLPNEMCTMAWITTKEYIYIAITAKQMKKNGDCISENEPGGTASVCITGKGRRLP